MYFITGGTSVSHITVTSQSHHIHITVTSQSHHSHITVTSQSHLSHITVTVTLLTSDFCNQTPPDSEPGCFVKTTTKEPCFQKLGKEFDSTKIIINNKFTAPFISTIHVIS